MITSQHWKELEESAIAPALAELNCRSLDGNFYGDRDIAISFLAQNLGEEIRTNTGKLKSYWDKKFSPIANGGGLLFSHTKGDFQLKPDCPREDPKKFGKKIKYETPSKGQVRAYLPFVDAEIAKGILDRHGAPLPENYEPKRFWTLVEQNKDLPRILTEGSKKSLSGL
ncbi:hypothetical protein, partial [Tychonema sp. LEGE 07203]|nr:hypothetical protein [Tychonema sp. LEGE 07203]